MKNNYYKITEINAHCHKCHTLGLVVSRVNAVRPDVRKTDLCKVCALKEHESVQDQIKQAMVFKGIPEESLSIEAGVPYNKIKAFLDSPDGDIDINSLIEILKVLDLSIYFKKKVDKV